jgi:hypothetical protein
MIHFILVLLGKIINMIALKKNLMPINRMIRKYMMGLEKMGYGMEMGSLL